MVGHCFRGAWTWTPSYVARPAVYGVVHGCRTFPGVKCLRGELLQLFWAGTNTGCGVCCLGSLQCLRVPMPVLRTTPSMVWTDTLFGVVRLAAHFEARRRFSGCMRTGLCCLASARWKPGDWPSHPGCLPCTFSSLSFYAARNMGRCGSISPAEFGVRSFKPVTGWRQCSSRLRRSFEREGLKTTGGGRLAGGASV